MKKIVVPQGHGPADAEKLIASFHRVARALGTLKLPEDPAGDVGEMELSIVTEFDVSGIVCSVCFSTKYDCPRTMEFLSDGTARWYFPNTPDKKRTFRSWEKGAQMFFRYLHAMFDRLARDVVRKRNIIKGLLK